MQVHERKVTKINAALLKDTALLIAICFVELVKVGLYDKTKQKELEEGT